jgi:hypothetical protein
MLKYYCNALLEEMSPSGNTVDRSHLNCLKHRVYCSNDPMIQIEAMDALAANGKQAIDIIIEIINSPKIDKQVKTHALVVMETIKNKDN